MALKGKAVSGGDYKQVPAGTYNSVCVAMFDLGTHWQSFKDKDRKKVRMTRMVFEVAVREKDDDPEERRFIGIDFNLAYDKSGNIVFADKANITKFLSAWQGSSIKGGDPVDLAPYIGKACSLSVKSTESGSKKYSNISGASPAMRDVKPLKPSHDLIDYDVPSGLDVPDFDWLPRVYGETAAAVIERCLERGGTGEPGEKKTSESNGTTGTDPGGEEIPF